MRRVNQCFSCQQLTTLSVCPRCDAPTAPYPAAVDPAPEDDWHAAGNDAPSSMEELTLEEVEAIATYHHRPQASCSPAFPAASSGGEALTKQVEVLQRENESLKAKLEGNRRQMLRSAMAVRQLHASSQQLRQQDQNIINELRGINAHLQERLVAATVAAAAAAAAPAAEAPPLLTAPQNAQPVSSAPTPPASAAPSVPPLNLRLATATAKEPENGFAASTSLRSPSQALSCSHNDDVPLLRSEVTRLNGAVMRKTQQLDGLWERVERAERFILELLAQLGYAQDLTQEETRNSARLSRHLANLGEPPADLAAFMAIKDRRGASRSTATSSCAPSHAGVRDAGTSPES